MKYENLKVLEYIKGIDFSDQKKVMKESGNYVDWPEEKFDYVEEQYKNFLYLCKLYPKKTFPPSEDIDKFWHEHILDTRNYFQACEIIYGEYKHHSPQTTGETDGLLDKKFNVLQELYLKHFGTYIYDFSLR